MTTSLKLRRGTTAQHASFTGAEGEVTVDTTKDTVVVHDGATAGGFPLAKEKFVQAGSGAVARTVDAKLKETVSIQDFGGVGDGVADDTAAVQAAVNASNYVFTNNGLTFKCTSQISISNKSLKIEGGSFVFTSNNGFVYSANSESQQFQLSDVKIYAGVEATGSAISASWTSSGSNFESCDFRDVVIRGLNSSCSWNTGININNGHNNTLDSVSIVNSAVMAKTVRGIYVRGGGVTTVVQNCYIHNVMTGVIFENGTYNSKVLNSQIHYCDTCVNFNYSTVQYGAILTVKDCLLYPLSYGVKGSDVIAIAIDNTFFQKEWAGTWHGVYLAQTGSEIFESIISNCQFGNNLGTGVWNAIYATGGNTLIVTENIFDSSSGTCITLNSAVENTIIKNNTNAQLIDFVANNNVNNIIKDNFQLYQHGTANSTDVATFNPPNIKNYLGNSQGDYFEFGNSGGAVSVAGIFGGVYWQHIHVRFNTANITLVHNSLTSGSKFDLKGGINYTPPAGSMISFIGVPDGSGNIIWREYSPRSTFNGTTGSVANAGTSIIFTTANLGFYRIYANCVGNTTVYAYATIYYDGGGTAYVSGNVSNGMSVGSSGANKITLTNSSGGAQSMQWQVVREK